MGSKIFVLYPHVNTILVLFELNLKLIIIYSEFIELSLTQLASK